MASKKLKFYDRIYCAAVELQIGKQKGLFSCSVETVMDGEYPVYVMKLSNKNDFYGLVHESLHLVKSIFRDRQIPFTPENDETIAYYQSWWVRKLWHEMHKRER